jgi:hypothetical protein
VRQCHMTADVIFADLAAANSCRTVGCEIPNVLGGVSRTPCSKEVVPTVSRDYCHHLYYYFRSLCVSVRVSVATDVRIG